MGVYKRGKTWWYHFVYAGRNIQESAKTTSKTLAVETERKRRREFEEGFAGVDRQRKDRVRTLASVAAVFLKEYKVKHPKSGVFAEYAIRHLDQHLGSKMLIEIDATVISDYQIARLEQHAAPKSINEEVGILLRIMAERGDLVGRELKRKRILKLAVGQQPGKAFDVVEKDRMTKAAVASRSPHILTALTLSQNAGMRDAEVRRTQWLQIDFAKAILTVGRAKTPGGEGRTIPLNGEIRDALLSHAKWYVEMFANFGQSGTFSLLGDVATWIRPDT